MVEYFTAARVQDALLGTVVIFFFMFVFGLMVHVIKNLIHSFLAAILGGRTAFTIVNYVTYPGTIHHELSHAFLAFLTGARVTGIHLVPRGKTLGSVEMIPRGGLILRSLQNLLSAVAPVLCGSISLYLLFIYIWPSCGLWWQMAAFLYIFVSILLHMDLSTADIKVALSGLPVCAAIVFLILLLKDSVWAEQFISIVRGIIDNLKSIWL